MKVILKWEDTIVTATVTGKNLTKTKHMYYMTMRGCGAETQRTTLISGGEKEEAK
jgi:hypothetical protein